MALYDEVINEFSQPKKSSTPMSTEEGGESSQMDYQQQAYQYMTDQLINEMENDVEHPVEKNEERVKEKKEKKKKGDSTDTFWAPSQLVMGIIFLLFVGFFLFMISAGFGLMFRSAVDSQYQFMELFR